MESAIFSSLFTFKGTFLRLAQEMFPLLLDYPMKVIQERITTKT